jgi:hypothetical protein
VTGTCDPKPANTYCGTVPGPSGTGSEIQKICDGTGNCKAPTIECPTGGAVVSCDLSANACCYESASSVYESCAPMTCSLAGQGCSATADCPSGQYCCEITIVGGHGWTNCTTAANCTTQLCDPSAATSGCLHGTCHDGGTTQLSLCE